MTPGKKDSLKLDWRIDLIEADIIYTEFNDDAGLVDIPQTDADVADMNYYISLAEDYD